MTAIKTAFFKRTQNTVH